VVHIRLMRAEDLQQIDRVQRAAFDPQLWEDTALFQSMIDMSPSSVFVAEENGDILGYFLTYPTHEDRDDFEAGMRPLNGGETALYAHDLCLHPAARGKGAARQLFAAAEDYAQRQGFARIIGISVQDSLKFWQSMGFQGTKPKTYHGMPGMFIVKDLTS
jgi:GNAT superfamily N-acetyltransferase